MKKPPFDASLALDAFTHPQFGIPSDVYPYRERDGTLLFVTARYAVDEARGMRREQLEPFTWSTDFDLGDWINRRPDEPALYGLETLDRLPRARVLIVDDERAVHAGRRVIGDITPVVTYGAGPLGQVDWEPLRGRACVVWMRGGTENALQAAEVATALCAVGCTVDVIDNADRGPQWGLREAVEGDGWTKTDVKLWVKTRQRKFVAPERPREYSRDEAKDAGPSASQSERWAQLGLSCSDRGKPHPNLDNVARILSARIKQGALYFDPFLNQMRYDAQGDGHYVKMEDKHSLALTLMVQREMGLYDVKAWTVEEALLLIGKARQFNSLQAYITGLQWDQEPRLESVFIRGFGAEDTSYNRAVGRCFLLGMVARAIRPGCQVDTMPVLEGAQGIGKSRGLAALGGEWYCDTDAAIGSREFTEVVQGKWLIEISELAAMRSSEVEKIKAGITRVSDTYREPYARLATDHPRSCVFAGTTNADKYLADDTGNRRFWPVRCGTVDREWLKGTRGQLFAEARDRLALGAEWWDIDAITAAAEAAKRSIIDSLHDRIRFWLDGRAGQYVSTNDAMDGLDIPIAQQNTGMQRRICAGFRACGYHMVKQSGRNVWAPPDTDARVTSLRTVKRI